MSKKRISVKDLETLIELLNELTEMPQKPWSYSKVEPATKSTPAKQVGFTKANVGNYHLEGAYGGWKLAQMVSTEGASRDVLHSGFVAKRTLYSLIEAFTKGQIVGRNV